ncbi:hypothetical protein [Paenirhodobacter sp.]|uniref:hypothetical protein n=1 Tax=Paenirhodobacter sp. TaxID=1965326 RepID=UPI003B416D37
MALCPGAMIRPDRRTGHLIRLSRVTVRKDFGYSLLVRPQAPTVQPNIVAFQEWVLKQRDSME